jgi:hypothetical protein
MSERLRDAIACLRADCADKGPWRDAKFLGLISMAREVCDVAEQAMTEHELALAEQALLHSRRVQELTEANEILRARRDWLEGQLARATAAIDALEADLHRLEGGGE